MVVATGDVVELDGWKVPGYVQDLMSQPDIVRIDVRDPSGETLAEIPLAEGEQRLDDPDVVVRSATAGYPKVVIAVIRTSDTSALDIERTHEVPLGNEARDREVTHPPLGEPDNKGAGPQDRQFERGTGRRR